MPELIEIFVIQSGSVTKWELLCDRSKTVVWQNSGILWQYRDLRGRERRWDKKETFVWQIKDFHVIDQNFFCHWTHSAIFCHRSDQSITLIKMLLLAVQTRLRKIDKTHFNLVRPGMEPCDGFCASPDVHRNSGSGCPTICTPRPLKEHFRLHYRHCWKLAWKRYSVGRHSFQE